MLTTKEVMIMAFQSLGSCTNSGRTSRGALSEGRKRVDELWASVLAMGGLLHTAGLTTGQYIPLAGVMQDTVCCEMSSERDASGVSCRLSVIRCQSQRATGHRQRTTRTSRAPKIAQRQPQALVQRGRGIGRQRGDRGAGLGRAESQAHQQLGQLRIGRQQRWGRARGDWQPLYIELAAQLQHQPLGGLLAD